jgi:hypothetical protein
VLTYARRLAVLAALRRGPWSYHGNTFLCSTTASRQPRPASSAPAVRPRRRSPLQRFQLQICSKLVGSPTIIVAPPLRPRAGRARQVPRALRPHARPVWRHAAITFSHRHRRQPQCGREIALEDAIAPPSTRTPASACTRLQIAGSATVILCSPASSQATLAPLLLQFSLRAILVCVSTHPRRHPHTLHLASLCSPSYIYPTPIPFPRLSTLELITCHPPLPN